MSNVKTALEESAALISKELLRAFPDADPDFSELQGAELYSLLAGGKRIRPFLVLETCKLFGGSEENALPLALAVEMVHTYSLIHDDLPSMDNDILRRGKPTCHVKYGEANALLAGDGLLTRAFLEIASAEHLTPECRVHAVRLLAEAAGDRGMLAGQVMDTRAETTTPSEDILLKTHHLKTGELIRVSCLLGALAAGVLPNESDPRIRAITSYSDSIGIAFQVIDDILDRTGNEISLGKPIGSDKENGKTTFLSFMSVEDAERYAVALTDSAVTAISDYDRDGLLTSLAYYLCDRTH